MTLDEVKSTLKRTRRRGLFYSPTEEEDLALQIGSLKRESVTQGNEEEAKLLWCYETIARIQRLYIEAFYRIKENRFYDAWCDLEQAEIAIYSLDRHFGQKEDLFCVEFIYKCIRQFQSLYPYALFMSPAFLAIDKRCSVCDQRLSLTRPCGHTVGEIYGGEICGRVVHKADLIELSLVRDPVNKYAVAFPVNPQTDEVEDNYNYSLVGYVASGLRNPFDGWGITWTQRRQPHDRYKNVGRNSACPCDSGKKYKSCCLNEEGVLQPHAQIDFSVPPPPGLPPFGYSDELRNLELSSGIKIGKGVPPKSLRPKNETA